MPSAHKRAEGFPVIFTVLGFQFYPLVAGLDQSTNIFRGHRLEAHLLNVRRRQLRQVLDHLLHCLMRHAEFAEVFGHLKGVEKQIIEDVDNLVGNFHVRQVFIDAHGINAQLHKTPRRVFIQAPAQIAVSDNG